MESGAPLLRIVVVDTQTSNERCAMREHTRKQKAKARERREPEVVELGLPLEEMVRRGAREILRQALEAEVRTLLDEYGVDRVSSRGVDRVTI